MSKRSNILDGRQSHLKYGLIYTEVLGWIDLGHAQGTDIKALLRKFDDGESSGQERYDVSYSQSMVDPSYIIKTGKFITWRIRKGRSYSERQSIALAMMMVLARNFEGFQASFPFNMVTDSGFSGEDLVSDLLGFYRAISSKNLFPALRPVSKEEALRRWDRYGPIGSFKNDSFLPLLFPDPQKYPNARPRRGVLPDFMTTIRPWGDFHSGKVGIATADGSYIDSAKKGTLPYA
ncbi:hypothetical protein ACMGGR_18690 [Erwinia sp. BNK-24-b]|uniref:hypothetical protein n=1 Tax=unclassified Erwinia TaxID=2622719 RepID=UPI0039BF4FB0